MRSHRSGEFQIDRGERFRLVEFTDGIADDDRRARKQHQTTAPSSLV